MRPRGRRRTRRRAPSSAPRTRPSRRTSPRTRPPRISEATRTSPRKAPRKPRSSGSPKGSAKGAGSAAGTFSGSGAGSAAGTFSGSDPVGGASKGSDSGNASKGTASSAGNASKGTASSAGKRVERLSFRLRRGLDFGFERARVVLLRRARASSASAEKLASNVAESAEVCATIVFAAGGGRRARGCFRPPVWRTRTAASRGTPARRRTRPWPPARETPARTREKAPGEEATPAREHPPLAPPALEHPPSVPQAPSPAPRPRPPPPSTPPGLSVTRPSGVRSRTCRAARVPSCARTPGFPPWIYFSRR